VGVKYSNNASTSLPGGINDSVTEITVTDASSFPAISSPDYAYLTLVSATALEVVKCTDITGNVLTVVRAQESTDAAAFVTDDRVELRVTTAMLTDALAETVAAAAASAAAAATSETNAAASYDNFDDRWLGSKSSDPSVDNDGATLLDGAAYYNTTTDKLMVYDLGGTTWNGTTPSSSEQTAINAVNTIAANVTTVAGISGNVTTVAGISANTTTVAGISGNVTTVAGISSNVTAVAGDATDIGAVAAKATEIGRLGTAAAVADMAILGETAIVDDMALLGASGVIDDMALLAIPAVITDMDLLGATGVIDDLETCADNVAGINNFAARYRVDSSDPVSSLDEGDLAYNSTANVLKYYNGSSWITIVAGSLTDIDQDGSPQLGADLDVQTYDIVSTTNRPITITPNGSGDVILDGLKYPQADGTPGQFLKTNGSAQLSFETIQGGDLSTEGSAFAHYNTITDDATTTTVSTKNMFLKGPMTVADTKTWTIAGNGVLQII